MTRKSHILGHLVTLFILLSCSIFRACNGTIWRTEEAYIIDDISDADLPESMSVNNIGYEHEHEHSLCKDSSGANGQCVPKEECNSFYDFFMEQEKQSKILEGLQRYINGTELESCKPSEADLVESNATNYVCCTSLKYNTDVKSINLTEYLALDQGQDPNQVEPEIDSATPDLSDFSKIVAGSEAGIGEFPYAIAILHNGRQMCGGSVISPNFVLSAAHCFDRFNSQAVRNLVIKVGAHDITRSGTSHLVSKLFLHPGFFRQKGYFRDDVALIKLKTPVNPSSYVKSVALHTGSPSINSGVIQAVVCGWGKTCAGSSCPQSSVLRRTELSIVSNSKCGQRYTGTSAPPITENMVCAGGQNSKDACNGGPLVIYSSGQTIQIGIVSWGIGCGQYPGVYTRVSNFVRWINKHKQKP